MKKRILIGGGPYWNSPFQVGSHHIAKGFADHGWAVAYLSDPISPLHVLKGVHPSLRERWWAYKSGGKLEYEEKIWSYVPGSLFTPNNKLFLRTKWVQRNWHRISIPPVVKKLQQNGFDTVDILYLGGPNDLYLLDCVNYQKSVFRIADKSSGFPNSTGASVDAEKEIARRADVVLYTARNLEDHVRSLSPKRAVYFPNGVNYQHFAGGSAITPCEYENIKKPIVLYVGAMAEWFDFGIVNEVAQKLPDISFVFIGPDELAKTRLKKHPNIHLLGPRSYSDLPAYMINADVGMIPFDMKNHANLVNSINPLKLYEYMACGLPVIAVEWQELKFLESPAVLYKTVEELLAAITKTCKQGKEKGQFFQAYANQHDWGKQLEKLLDFRFEDDTFKKSSS